jgi:serine/threonine-protein kinase RsbW
MTRLMDEVRFDFDPDVGNLLTLVKNLSTAASTDVTLLPLHGRIDAVTSPQMSAEIRARIDAGTRYLLLDLSDVSFMSSSGLRTLLVIRKNLMTLGGELRLAALQPQVMEIFDITGFAQVFAIHTSLDEAQDAFGQGRV